MCRDLKHAWSRTNVMKPTKFRNGRPVEAERTLTCLGKCGTERVERFDIFGDGRLARQSKPQYRRTKPYLITREPGEDRSPVDTDSIRFALLTRMYPDLKW